MGRHGGKRAGAGRPRLAETRQTLAVRVKPETRQWLQDQADDNELSLGQVIDWLVNDLTKPKI